MSWNNKLGARPWVLSMAVVLGAAIGATMVPSSSYAWDCDMNACDATGGNCQLVSHSINCDETADGCRDEGCVILPSDSTP